MSEPPDLTPKQERAARQARRFGRNLQAVRLRHGVSQEALSTAAGLHRATVYLVENGEREPRLSTIIALAEGLGIDPGELLGGPRP